MRIMPGREKHVARMILHVGITFWFFIFPPVLAGVIGVYFEHPGFLGACLVLAFILLPLSVCVGGIVEWLWRNIDFGRFRNGES